MLVSDEQCLTAPADNALRQTYAPGSKNTQSIKWQQQQINSGNTIFPNGFAQEQQIVAQFERVLGRRPPTMKLVRTLHHHDIVFKQSANCDTM